MPFADESHKFWVGREFASVNEFGQWWKVQNLGREPFNAVGFHHTQVPDETQWKGRSSFKGMYDSYYRDRGWRPWGMGPHLFLAITAQGPRIYVGVHPRHNGAGIADRNDRWYHIDHVCNGDKAPFSAAMKKLSGAVLAVVCADRIPLKFVRVGVDAPAKPLGIMFHRDVNRSWRPGAEPKSCPGLEVSHGNLDADVLAAARGANGGRGEPRPTSGPYRVKQYVVTTAPDGLNLRVKPTAGSRSAGLLPKGTRLGVLWVAQDPDWRRVKVMDGKLAGKFGYVHEGYIEPERVDDPRIEPSDAILSPPRAELAHLMGYIVPRDTAGYSDDEVRHIARLYWETSVPVGLDPLIVFAQMCHETGNLTSPWSQRPYRNPAGIGVTGEYGGNGPGGMKGESFGDWETAVRAHVGRLLAYALPKGRGTAAQRALMDEALRVRALPDSYRGIAPTIAGLATRPGRPSWAADTDYAGKVVRKAEEIRRARPVRVGAE